MKKRQKRHGSSSLKSILKDEWRILSPEGRDIGIVTEKSWLGAVLSRFINLIPQTYTVNSVSGRDVAVIKQHFNPFILKYSMTVSDAQGLINRRLLIAAGILLAAIEGRQGLMPGWRLFGALRESRGKKRRLQGAGCGRCTK